MPIKGKQIQDESLELKKISGGTKILADTDKLGINKTPAQFTDPNEYITKAYVDDLSDDVDNETIVVDGTVLKVNLKTPGTDEIGLSVDGTNGIFISKTDISNSVLAGDTLTSTVDGNGVKTLEVNLKTPDATEIGISVDGTNGLYISKSDLSGSVIAGDGLSSSVDGNGVKTLDVNADNTALTGDEVLVRFGTNGDLVVDYADFSNKLDLVDTATQTVASDLVLNGVTNFNDDALTSKTVEQFTNTSELVSKGYVDSVASGLDWKESAVLATDQDLTTWTYTQDPTGGTNGWSDTITFTGTISASDIDSASTAGLSIGDRFLVKDQTDAKQNGIYELTASDTLTRATDHDGSPSNEVSGGNAIFIETGTYTNTGWVLGGVGDITLNTDELNWTQFSGSSPLSAGAGLVKTGNILDVELATNSGLEFDAVGDAGKLQIDAKTPASTDVGIQLTGGVHILKSDISATIVDGTGLTSSVDGDGIKTLNLDTTTLAGAGLEGTTGIFNVNVDDSTIEIVSDTLQVKANGINDTHIDYGTAGTQVSSDSIPTLGYNWLGTSVSGESIQSILETLDSDIQSVGGATTASNGLNKNINDIQLGGDLTSNVVISGDTGLYDLTMNDMKSLTLATTSGYSLVLDETSAIFTDTLNSKGLEYATDYSANFTNNSLITKAYVDANIGGGNTTTAGNGLTMVGDSVELGGSLTQNTTIDGASGAYNFVVNDINTLTLATSSGYSLSMNGSATFTDDKSSAGLAYNADYSANYVDRSLVDKGYVDSEILSSSTSGYSAWDTLETSGSGVSGTSGLVSYQGAITFGEAIDEATVFVNGVRLKVPLEASFGTSGEAQPAPGDTLYFDLDVLDYDIDSADEIMITYLTK